ncbi:MAG: MATE family efflux transporter [Alcanivorax sp.]|jgi:multidrug resistance protein, MATE family|uniref:MATE family efflux transporter n=1 Tax=unclassified Ketobacter TaxID=2639109 RepID=UPI000F1725F1|nr:MULTISPECIES: MATE family efflux transporter [unclassified Ketobacter]MEC8810015.1 MATE family efflux transporter [Pseudomonadota bacterium]TNC88693.1 MAG: MATE family efflux transporter [Alcanivorax sp.]MCK5792077.1 MATE family efflux transporter [Ketobacter sp.]RLT89102.1 MAG: MATE family efflux transporter [Ketobacter sp. GenoA1]RLT97242.1 MAG: MATE family efflux transporter [Ketobacter sp.]|tara:strand:- start:1113 stop:2450 length:1338 start_codon:yes stop_codon:yes gene_type:complete
MTGYWPDTQRRRQIWSLALPIMAGMISQSILNIVDTWMVSHLGSHALAAVGMASNTNYLASAAVIGLGAGVQAMVARRRGENNVTEMALPLNTGLLIALIMAIPLFLVFFFSAKPLMAFLIDDPQVTPLAADYFAIRIAGLFALGMNFSFRGYWNGINRSTVYMRTLIVMHVVNIILSYGLIFGAFGLPELGVVGAGLGTTLALYLASILYLIQCWLFSRNAGFLRAWPGWRQIKDTLQLALPNSIQQVFFAGGLTTLFWIIAQVGTNELAIGHVLITIILFLILPAMGLGMAATSLVSQSLGRSEPNDAYLWGVNITLLGMLFLWLVALPLVVMPDQVLSLFFQEPALIELARAPLQITGLFIGLDACGIILSQALLGAGASRSVMKISILLQWGFFIPAAFLVGPYLGLGLLGIWICQLLQRLLQAIIMAYQWRAGRWATIRI